ncbi:hypothetical protein BGZ94_004377 [Podila epigama]|nr:hypothetical protein BGZ94_004377 [Podila epigama]
MPSGFRTVYGSTDTTIVPGGERTFFTSDYGTLADPFQNPFHAIIHIPEEEENNKLSSMCEQDRKNERDLSWNAQKYQSAYHWACFLDGSRRVPSLSIGLIPGIGTLLCAALSYWMVYRPLSKLRICPTQLQPLKKAMQKLLLLDLLVGLLFPVAPILRALLYCNLRCIAIAFPIKNGHEAYIDSLYYHNKTLMRNAQQRHEIAAGALHLFMQHHRHCCRPWLDNHEAEALEHARSHEDAAMFSCAFSMAREARINSENGQRKSSLATNPLLRRTLSGTRDVRSYFQGVAPLTEGYEQLPPTEQSSQGQGPPVAPATRRIPHVVPELEEVCIETHGELIRDTAQTFHLHHDDVQSLSPDPQVSQSTHVSCQGLGTADIPHQTSMEVHPSMLPPHERMATVAPTAGHPQTQAQARAHEDAPSEMSIHDKSPWGSLYVEAIRPMPQSVPQQQQVLDTNGYSCLSSSGSWDPLYFEARRTEPIQQHAPPQQQELLSVHPEPPTESVIVEGHVSVGPQLIDAPILSDNQGIVTSEHDTVSSSDMPALVTERVSTVLDEPAQMSPSTIQAYMALMQQRQVQMERFDPAKVTPTCLGPSDAVLASTSKVPQGTSIDAPRVHSQLRHKVIQPQSVEAVAAAPVQAEPQCMVSSTQLNPPVEAAFENRGRSRVRRKTYRNLIPCPLDVINNTVPPQQAQQPSEPLMEDQCVDATQQSCIDVDGADNTDMTLELRQMLIRDGFPENTVTSGSMSSHVICQAGLQPSDSISDIGNDTTAAPTPRDHVMRRESACSTPESFPMPSSSLTSARRSASKESDETATEAEEQAIWGVQAYDEGHGHEYGNVASDSDHYNDGDDEDDDDFDLSEDEDEDENDDEDDDDDDDDNDSDDDEAEVEEDTSDEEEAFRQQRIRHYRELRYNFAVAMRLNKNENRPMSNLSTLLALESSQFSESNLARRRFYRDYRSDAPSPERRLTDEEELKPILGASDSSDTSRKGNLEHRPSAESRSDSLEAAIRDVLATRWKAETQRLTNASTRFNID